MSTKDQCLALRVAHLTNGRMRQNLYLRPQVGENPCAQGMRAGDPGSDRSQAWGCSPSVPHVPGTVPEGGGATVKGTSPSPTVCSGAREALE